MGEKNEYDNEKDVSASEKAYIGDNVSFEEAEEENSKIEAVRLVVPLTDDTSLVALTFRFWVLSTFFSILGSVIQQYYMFRVAKGTFSIYFVNLASYGLGTFMARVLPTKKWTIGSHSLSLNPGPFNIKEHALIGIAVSTASNSAYAIYVLSVMDLFLHYRISALGAMILILTTQCLGYGMAGTLRRYLVYPAEMVWWSNLVQVVFYNAMHNTDEFKNKKMIRGWSYMKYFWVFCTGMFLYEFIPQFFAPMLIYFDWICWIKPFDYNFWALFSSHAGGGAGILSLTFEWTFIGGQTMWLPLATQLGQYGGIILSYWIIFPIIWMNNIFNAKLFGRPLTSRLYHLDGKAFDINTMLNPDYTINEEKYNAGVPVTMTPMYALIFLYSFIALGGCVTHIICFHGDNIWKTWKATIKSSDEDIHHKMMSAYAEVPQLWYAIFYVIMLALSMLVVEVYDLQLPWYGVLIAVAIGWAMTLPIGAMVAITGTGPGLNVLTQLACGFIFPGKTIANMTFKCYGYMAMYQCHALLSDLKLGVYMKIPPRSMFTAQVWGTFVGGIFNYITMIIIINTKRPYLNGDMEDPTGLWTGVNPQIYWGSALIYGAFGPAKMFGKSSQYHFIYWGFLIGAVIPIIQWGLSKKFPNIKWSTFNIAVFAGGMSEYPGGLVIGVICGLAVCLVWQGWLFHYHKNWWSKYTFILAAALDTGAAFTGLFLFLFLQGGIHPKIAYNLPSWFMNHHTPEGTNAPYKSVDRCGAHLDKWQSGND
ncbi:hypothetical protein BGZ96_009405 [Linnemannia gamsii]|uniref:OPT superfamily oligopeptide transporter n=1 Tax=Linnemannia gamsii TaxID=64522 RepID=A0ABQ7KDN2_9FUNG|nr:hypothetical protein BGZ96_009405 [Linnemannia gamsii]